MRPPSSPAAGTCCLPNACPLLLRAQAWPRPQHPSWATYAPQLVHGLKRYLLGLGGRGWATHYQKSFTPKNGSPPRVGPPGSICGAGRGQGAARRWLGDSCRKGVFTWMTSPTPTLSLWGPGLTWRLSRCPQPGAVLRGPSVGPFMGAMQVWVSNRTQVCT